MKIFRYFWLVLLMLLSACSKPDPTVILGNWRADSFNLESLKLPIAPNFEVTRSALILKEPDGTILQELPLREIRAYGDSIELEPRDGFGVSLVFKVESKDLIKFKVPLIGFDIIYSRTP